MIAWLEVTVAGWNAEPTPFLWDDQRRERRQRSRRWSVITTSASSATMKNATEVRANV
jgi:hypothetical protein